LRFRSLAWFIRSEIAFRWASVVLRHRFFAISEAMGSGTLIRLDCPALDLACDFRFTNKSGL